MSTIAPDDYLSFCEGLRRICGIDLTQYKRPQMERRLRSFFERRGLSRLTDSLDGLRRDPVALDALLDRVTINVSQLWRHPEQWEWLSRTVLRDIASSRPRVRAWSAGCSYGAEAYTLAAVCREAIPGVPVQIVGTDIDRRMVARAREGVFSADEARAAPAGSMQRFFEPAPSGWQAKAELRGMTRFEVGDLLTIEPTASIYDLVMCRNTVIYFAEPIRDELHARLAHSLRRGGYLVIGATERVTSPTALGLEPAHPFILRKR
jgi:chemotaxis protein methyltransferase CheR